MTSTTHSNTCKVDLTWLEQYHRIVVIGLGMSGVGVVKALTKRGITVDVQDSRDNPAGLSEIQAIDNVNSIHLGGFDQEKLLNSDLLIVSPGVSLRTPELQSAIDAGVEISGDIDIVSRSINVPIVAVTGSNGKSTVTQLAGEICQLAGYKTFIGGNIGLSAMELLDEKECDVAVLELSSFQLETTPALAAHSAVLLNLSPDHLDRYDNFQDYAQAKLAIYKQVKHLVWNRDDEWLKSIEFFDRKTVKSIVSFGLNEPSNDVDLGLSRENEQTWLVKGEKKLLLASASQLLGEHNYANVLAALAILDSFAIDIDVAKIAISQFSGLAHRMQFIREKGGVVWINDSKATNVGATMAAIEGLKGSIVLIAGGQSKGTEFDELLPALKKYVSHVCLIGEDADKIYAAWSRHVQCKKVASLKDAVSYVNNITQNGQYALFAPACASFDMFESFVDRGNQFMQLVNDL